MSETPEKQQFTAAWEALDSYLETLSRQLKTPEGYLTPERKARTAQRLVGHTWVGHPRIAVGHSVPSQSNPAKSTHEHTGSERSATASQRQQHPES